MNTNNEIGLDSQCFTYLIDAMAKPQEPTDALAEQRIALFRVFLYRKGGLFLTPTVRKEFEAIPSTDRAAHHSNWTTLFPETQPIDQSKIDRRAVELRAFHRDAGDCYILAEAEDAGLRELLTFDSAFISNLSSHTKSALRRPADCWNRLGIPRGASPVTIPRGDNPLSGESWWRWT